MVSEDLQHTRVRHVLYLRNSKAEQHTLQLELQNLRSAAITRDDELATVTANHTYLQETSKADLLKLNLTATKLQESVRDLSAKNQELVKETAKMKARLTSRDGDLDRYTTEIEQLRNTVAQSDAVNAQREAEAAQNLKMATNQRDDATFQLLSISAQLENTTAQSKTDQARYWEELTRLKDGETQLLEECEKLTHELSDKTLRLHSLETERTSAESNMRVEVSGASSMVNALKEELERRLEDLVVIRKERDGLVEDNEGLAKQTEELRQELVKSDAMFKRTIETDRGKMKQELTTRTNRIKTLEMEKQEMLNEMNELVKQATDAQRAVTSAQNEAEDQKLRADKLGEQTDWIKTKNVELLDTIKAASTVEQELRDKSYATETRLKEEINRLQTTITDTKKVQLVDSIHVFFVTD
jgi:chromosome segregation ATPase